MNLCRFCDQDFGSVSAFDAHRLGQYGPGDYKGELEDWSAELGRRCLTVDEIEADPRFVQNSLGRWSLADDLEAARLVRESKAGRAAAIVGVGS
jgi:hypothetical protein